MLIRPKPRDKKKLFKNTPTKNCNDKISKECQASAKNGAVQVHNSKVSCSRLRQ